MSKTTPTEEELRTALVALKATHPELGISKTHTKLLKTRPDWLVSEKRTRKILQSEGLVHTDSPVSLTMPIYTPPVYPSSHFVPNIEISRWTNKVQVHYFSPKKGKGLIAAQDLSEGEIIWREDPFIIAPEWDIYDLQTSSAACGFCITPLDLSSPLILSCPASTSTSFCPFRFCNRLCLSRSAKNHPLLCHAQNPASKPLLTMAKEMQWMTLHAWANCVSRLLLAGQRSDDELWRDWAVIWALAELGMEDRHKYSFDQASQSIPEKELWKKAFDLFIEAFRKPKDPEEEKKLQKILKKPIPPELARELFEYDPGFMKALGRMSLNLEAHGGLYTLHSHLNHSCTPNVSVRHLDRRNALARITILAKRPIKAGEELLVTYVNPELGVRARRQELRAWGFGDCLCNRCVKEAKQIGTSLIDQALSELAEELKAGLGVRY